MGAVTIATNMAGRGTDILLGGNPEVLAEDALRERGFDPALEEGAEVEEGRAPAPSAEDRAEALVEAKRVCAEEHDRVIAAGGLTVIGTERHESPSHRQPAARPRRAPRRPRAPRSSTCRWKTTSCACSAATAWTPSRA